MSNSQLFSRLKRRAELLEDLLPADRADGEYAESEQDLIRSYRVLVHSEFEEYLEKRVEAILRRELNLMMGQCGTRNLKEITPAVLVKV